MESVRAVRMPTVLMITGPIYGMKMEIAVKRPRISQSGWPIRKYSNAYSPKRISISVSIDFR